MYRVLLEALYVDVGGVLGALLGLERGSGLVQREGKEKEMKGRGFVLNPEAVEFVSVVEKEKERVKGRGRRYVLNSMAAEFVPLGR